MLARMCEEDLAGSDAVTRIAAAQAAIRATFDQLPIWRRERDLALHNMLAVQAVEAYKAFASPQETEILHVHRWFVEASVRAIPEIIRRCPNAASNLVVSEETFNEAFELVDFAHVYETVDYSMHLQVPVTLSAHKTSFG